MIKTFKKYFIVLDGTQSTLYRAVKKAESMGYKKFENGTEEENILDLDDEGDYYFTDYDKNFLIDHGYTELTLEPNIHYVYVSDDSVEDALEDKEKRIFIADLGEKFKYRYICVDSYDQEKYLNGEKDIDFVQYRYIAEIPKEEDKTELSLQEIADKFGVDKSSLLIKE